MIKKYLKYLYHKTASESTKKLNSLFEKNRDAKFLDLGCWDGSNTIEMGKKIGTKKLYGIEIVKEKAEIAKKRGIKVYISDLNSKFPLKNKSADVAVAYHVIEHLSKPDKFIKECYRVLDKEGYLLIGTPNLASWHNIFALLIGSQPFSGPHVNDNTHGEIKSVNEVNSDRYEKVFSKNSMKNNSKKEESLRHLVVMTTKALKRLLESEGFTVEKIYGFGYHPLPGFAAKLFSGIDPYHSHYIVIKARKN